MHTIACTWCIINVYPHGAHGVPLLQIARISKHDKSIHLLAHSVMEYSLGNIVRGYHDYDMNIISLLP